MVVHIRRATAWAAVMLAAGLTAAACSTGSGTTPSNAAAASSTGISPGSGQSALAGVPGSTATGPVGTDSAMPGMTMSAPAGASSGAAVAPVSGDSVEIKNFAFAPAALIVKAGTKVTWTNEDTDAHTVTSQNNAGVLNSPALNTGQSFTYTFTKPGTYSYQCTIHPFMTATVTVTP